MKNIAAILVLAVALMPTAAFSQGRGRGNAPAGPPTKTTYVPLQGGNAVLVELVTPDPVRSKIGVVVIHPEHANNFNYFTGVELAKRGYRAMMVNYYGPERSFYEFITPLSSAIKAMRGVPGVEKVVLVGHSSGGPVLASYQNIAEKGPKACQGPERVFKCDGKNPNLDNLPKADGIMMIDSAAGAPERTDALNPAVDAHNPRAYNATIDMFNPKNGYDPATKAATYSPDFQKKFFAAQAARSTQLTDEAQARLAKIEKGEGIFKEDEPFVVAGSTVGINGSRPQLADVRLLSKSHAPHPMVGVEGALHSLMPCKPEYGDTFKRSFDYMDTWLLKPGRL